MMVAISFPNGLCMDSVEYSADSLQIVQQPLPRGGEEAAVAEQGRGGGAEELSPPALASPDLLRAFGQTPWALSKQTCKTSLLFLGGWMLICS